LVVAGVDTLGYRSYLAGSSIESEMRSKQKHYLSETLQLVCPTPPLPNPNLPSSPCSASNGTGLPSFRFSPRIVGASQANSSHETRCGMSSIELQESYRIEIPSLDSNEPWDDSGPHWSKFIAIFFFGTSSSAPRAASSADTVVVGFVRASLSPLPEGWGVLVKE
uniref:Uncharacterized protein n=1 Tax=Anopheles coluzzii TaxID=1518534 RepID=A0A8W7PQT3_ANOCL